MARRKEHPLYYFFIVFPDRLYPFAETIRGKSVRGIRAYNHAAARYERKYGRGHFGVWINCYRTFFHIIGSVAIILVGGLVVRELFGTERALYIILGIVTALITYQEFYYHPRYYHQLFKKGILDWFAWVAPIGFYVFFLS